MANALRNGNIWYVDTAGASTIMAGKMHVSAIRWVGASSSGDQAIIQDVDGVQLWASKAAGSNNVEESVAGGCMGHRYWRNGFKVPTLDSGTLEIELA